MIQRALAAASLYGVLPKDPRPAVLGSSEQAEANLLIAAAPSPTRKSVQEIVTGAEAVGFALVEPEIAAFKGIPFAIGRPITAIDRALFAVVLLGLDAHPLLFVPKASAPKNGLPKVREDRMLDGWLASTHAPSFPKPTLASAAFEVLAKSAEPMRGKDLLREARATWIDAMQKRGQRVSTSTGDGPTLARDLYAAWLRGEIELKI